jgi:hypothetical protein
MESLNELIGFVSRKRQRGPLSSAVLLLFPDGLCEQTNGDGHGTRTNSLEEKKKWKFGSLRDQNFCISEK